MGSTWTRQQVGIEIRKLKRAGHPLNVRAVKHLALHWHALSLFGSWGAAIRSAGLDYDKIRKYKAWSKAFILKWIRREAKRRRDLRPSRVEEKERALYTAACRRFGGWYPALRAAGVRGIKEHTPRRWDEGTLVRALMEFGPEATYSEIRAKDKALLPALRGHFGSYATARRAAGFIPSLPRKRRLWPRERILEIIRSRAATHPRLRTRDFSDLGGMWAAAMEIFGSWPNAVRAAGCPYTIASENGPRKWTREKVLEKVQDQGRKGKSLRKSRFQCGLVASAERTFGSWEGTLKEAGFLPPARQRKWTPERILSTLRVRAKDGVAPRMARFPGSGIYEAAKKAFGSWEGAGGAAGLRPAPRAWKWSRDRILSEIQKLKKRGIPLTSNSSFYAAFRKVFGGVKAAKKAGVLTNGRVRVPKA